MGLLVRLLSSLSNLRILAACLTLTLLLSPLSISWLAQPNQLFFKVGAHLTPKPEPSNQLVKVVVPQAEMDRLVNDMPGALGVGNLLLGLHGVFTKGVLLITDELPESENYASDVLVKRLVNDTALREALQASGVLADVEALGQRRDNFYSLVLDGSLLLGIVQNGTTQDRVNYLRETSVVPSKTVAVTPLSRVNNFFEPASYQLAAFRFESKTPAFAVYGVDKQSAQVGPGYPLLWRVGKDYFPDATLALLKKTRGVNQILRQPSYLLLDDKAIPSSSGDLIYPMYSSRTGLDDNMETILLSDLKTQVDYNRFYNKTVIIGVENRVSDVAATYYSLERHAYYVVPEWYLLAEKAGLVLLFLYLFFLLPLFRINVGLMVSAFIAVGVLVVQIGLQISQMLWLPVGLLFVYLLLGHMLALLWMTTQKNHKPIVAAQNRPVDKRNNLVGKTRAREEPKLSSVKGDETGFAKTLAFTRKDKTFKLGRYEVDSELGRGAMGVVYLGHDPSIDRKVAIKTLNYAQFPADTLQEVKERFFREAKAAGNLKHQNIVTIYEMAEDAERAFIAMEYVGGKPLSAYIKKGQLLPVDEVYWIVAQVAEALGYAHEHSIVHRDIKPSNILYDRDRQEVKVADFGIARITDNASTKTGDILGSPLYMSPEQIKGEKVAGQTDIFSLGITFYQLLTGQLPFNGDSMVAITHQIVNGKFQPVTDINPKLPESAQRIIAKALQKNPEKRFESAYEMSDMLQKYMGKD